MAWIDLTSNNIEKLRDLLSQEKTNDQNLIFLGFRAYSSQEFGKNSRFEVLTFNDGIVHQEQMEEIYNIISHMEREDKHERIEKLSFLPMRPSALILRVHI